MKETLDYVGDVKSIPTLLMHGSEDAIVEPKAIIKLKENLKSDEFYYKNGKVYIMKSKMSLNVIKSCDMY